MTSSRSHRAAALARRVERHHAVATESVRWSALAALWLHFGTLLVLHGLYGRLPPGPDVRYVEVTRVPADRVGDAPLAAGPELALEGRTGPRGAQVEAIPPPPTSAAPTPAAPPPDRTPRRVARTERRTADQAPDIDVVSAHDVAADGLQYAPVTADADGLPTPPSDGGAELAASPTLERRRGDPSAASGNRSDGELGPIVVGGGGGAPLAAAGTAEGAPHDGPPDDDGGAGGASAAGGDDRSVSAAGAGAPTTVAAPPGPEAVLPDSGPAPGWWQPLATRFTPATAPTSAPGAVAAHAPSPVLGAEPSGSGTGAGERVGRRGTAGGARVVADRATQSDPRDATTAPERGLRRIAAVGTADPVAELREALGFGPLDRDALAPRPAWAGALRQEGAQDSSSQAAIEAPIAWRTAFSARGTAEGAYLQRVSERIEAQWSTKDLDLHSRATGVQGEVTLQYEIRRDGRIAGVRLVRSSGNDALDRMALTAIPARVDRFPPDLPARTLLHEITFRYRNPLVGP